LAWGPEYIKKLMPALEPKTTGGIIAMRNLQAQIEGHPRLSALSVATRILLIDLIALRGHICGQIADSEEAAALAEELVRDAPDSGPAFFARARTSSAFHLFSAALSDLELAQQRGMDSATVHDERAAIFEAIGSYDEALALRREAGRTPTFQSIAGLASIYAAQGECDHAERLFQDSRDRYRDVSPFPLAMLDFQRGHMWVEAGELARARACFAEAQERLPAYAPAQGHLAEVEAALGDVEPAIARLRPFAISCDDPDYAAQLARILDDAGRLEEARLFRATAALRYETLVTLHLEAFADHAAEFWLWQDADPERALRFARVNFEVRKTKRARALLDNAIVANQRWRTVQRVAHSSSLVRQEWEP
jgi:tetratricopeptide (TPR) repeat protein